MQSTVCTVEWKASELGIGFCRYWFLLVLVCLVLFSSFQPCCSSFCAFGLSDALSGHNAPGAGLKGLVDEDGLGVVRAEGTDESGSMTRATATVLDPLLPR